MAANALGEALSRGDSEPILVCLRGGIGELFAILEVYQGWRDPLSQKIHTWALDAFENVEGIQDLLARLNHQILVDSLYGEPMESVPLEIPYLIDGENTLPEPLFDQLYCVASRVGQGRSPFNQRPLVMRQRVHEFALALLRLQERSSQGASPLQERHRSLERASLSDGDWGWIKNLAQGRETLRSHEEESFSSPSGEEIATRHQLQLARMKEKLRDLDSPFNRRLEAFVRSRLQQIGQVEQQIHSTKQELEQLHRELSHSEALNQLKPLEGRLEKQLEEIGKRRAEMSVDSWCTIS